MWLERVLVLLLLQRVLGHTLSRYEPQETEVYELRQDKDANTVQFVYPKSSVPKLREIIYYHIIEKPYQEPPEETASEVSPEAETVRLPTNTHGYQFLDNLLVDYDSATESSANPPEEVEYQYFDEDGNLYQVPAAEQNEGIPAQNNETYEPVAESAETNEHEQIDEPADTAEPDKTAAEEATELQKQLTNEDNNYNVEEDLVTDEAKAGIYVTKDNTDLTKTESDLAETDEITYADSTADVAIETTEPMTEEATGMSQDEELAVDEIVKKLEARSQLYGSMDKMKERLLKIRNYLPHLHPMNSQFSPEVISSKRRRRRSVHAKKNSRRRREIFYIYPQGRSLSELDEESEIPAAPTLSPMDTAGLPDFIRSELNPEDVVNAESDAETLDIVPENSEFVPPPNTYGVQLNNGNGYVWNTLYGSASTEQSISGEKENTTPYAAAIEELPAELPASGDIPEESQGEEELGVTEETPSEIPEATIAELDERFLEVEEIPADEFTEVLPGDNENAEESFPKSIDPETITERSPDDIASKTHTTKTFEDALEHILLEIFDLDLEKKDIEGRIHEHLDAEKSAITDDSLDQEKEVIGNNDGDIATETDSEGELIVPEDHGTYGFRLIGGQGEVWNDNTGVRYHVGNEELSSDNFHNFEPGFDEFKKPDYIESILEPFDDITDKQSGSDKTTKDQIISNDLAEKIAYIFNDFKNLAYVRSDNQVSTALPDVSDSSIQSSPFLALLEDDLYRDWVQKWTIEYTRFLSEYIDDSVQAAIAKKELALLNAEAPMKEEIGTARLYLNDEELKKSPEVDTIINTISEKYLRRRRKHCQESESNAGVSAENIYGGSLNSGKIVNVFVFFTEEQGEKILDLIKPGTKDEEIDSEYVDTSDGEYKPDESELEAADEEEGVVYDNATDEPTNVEEKATEPSDAIEIIDEETLEPVLEEEERGDGESEVSELVEEEPENQQPSDQELHEASVEVADPIEEEAVEDAALTDEEAVEDAEPIDGEAVTDAEPIEEEAVEDAKPIEEADDNAELKEEADENVKPVEEEAVEDNEQTDEEAVTDAELIEEEAVEDAKPIEEEADDNAEPIEEEAEDNAQPIEKEAVEDNEQTEQAAVKDAELTNEEIVEDSEPRKDEAVEDAEPNDEEAVEDVEPEDEAVVDAKSLEAEAVEDAGPTEDKAVENDEPVQVEAAEDIEPVEEEAVEDVETEQVEPVEDVEPVEEEAVENDEAVAVEAAEDAEPIEEEAVEDFEPEDEAVVDAKSLEAEAVEDAGPTEDKAVENDESVQVEAAEDIEPVEEEAVEHVEPVEEEAVENDEAVEVETAEDAEPIEEEAVEDVESVQVEAAEDMEPVEDVKPVQIEAAEDDEPGEEEAVENDEPVEEEAVKVEAAEDIEPVE